MRQRCEQPITHWLSRYHALCVRAGRPDIVERRVVGVATTHRPQAETTDLVLVDEIVDPDAYRALLTSHDLRELMAVYRRLARGFAGPPAAGTTSAAPPCRDRGARQRSDPCDPVGPAPAEATPTSPEVTGSLP